jgi:hypothetical protein
VICDALATMVLRKQVNRKERHLAALCFWPPSFR